MHACNNVHLHTLSDGKFSEVVTRLVTHGHDPGVVSEEGRREVREGIDQETDHVLVNVTHPGSHQGRRERRSPVGREMVSKSNQSFYCVHVYICILTMSCISTLYIVHCTCSSTILLFPGHSVTFFFRFCIPTV